MERCLYVSANGADAGNPAKISSQTFEPVEHRDDWIKTLMEVAQDNIAPFMKSLFALFYQGLEAQKGFLQSKPKTTA